MHNTEVFNNYVHSCNAYGIAISNENGGFIRDTYIYNNLIANNYLFGISMHSWGIGATHAGNNLHVYHNTVYSNGRGLSISNAELDSVYIYDNIFANNDWLQIKVEEEGNPSHLIMDNNILVGTTEYLGLNPILSDPLFSNPENLEFTLLENSPAINNSTGKYNITFDYNDSFRTDGLADIGAYEYLENKLKIINATKELEDIIFPNPTSSFIYLHKKIEFELINIWGDLLFKDYSNKIEMTAYPKGTYFIITDKHRIKVLKQ